MVRKVINSYCQLLSWLMVASLALMVVLVFTNVVLRYAFNSGIAVSEELSRGYASVADQCGLIELISSLLVRHGTEAQRRLLPGILAMKTKVAYCITEPEAGTDVSGIRTTATPDGDGWRLNGGKIWIHNAPVADLPILRIVGGKHFVSDLTLPHGRVLFDYIKDAAG